MNLITFDLETFTMDQFRFIKIHTWIESLGHKQQQQQQQQITLKLADEKEIPLFYKPQKLSEPSTNFNSLLSMVDKRAWRGISKAILF